MVTVYCVLCVCSLGPPPAPSRGVHKYYATDADDERKDYVSSGVGVGSGNVSYEPAERRSYRSSDTCSPTAPVSCRSTIGRYTTSPAAAGLHDDVFLDTGSSGRAGYKTSSSADQTTSSRGNAAAHHSPSESERAARGSGGTRTASISPTSGRRGRYHSKERKILSPTSSSRHDDTRSARRNSLESPDERDQRYSTTARPSAADTGHRRSTWTYSAGDCTKSSTRTVANDSVDTVLVAGECSNVSDRLLRTSDSSSEIGRRHVDKDTASRTNTTVRSVVNPTPSWKFDSDYKHHRSASRERGSDWSRDRTAPVVNSNHIDVTLAKLRRSEPLEVTTSDSTTSPRIRSPRAGSDLEEPSLSSGTHPPDQPASSDDMTHLEKEKSHLLSMLRELEDYSSGGSEIEALDEESRAVLCRQLHHGRWDDGTADNDSDVSTSAVADASATLALRQPTTQLTTSNHGHNDLHDVLKPSTGNSLRTDTASRSEASSLRGVAGADAVSSRPEMAPSSARRLSDTTSRRSSTSSDTRKQRRASVENHVGGPVITSSLDAEDNIVDLIGCSPPAEIPAEFTHRRHRRSSSEVSGGSAAVSGKPRRFYRSRDSTADSADSGAEDASSSSALRTEDTQSSSVLRTAVTTHQTSDAGSSSRLDSSAAVPLPPPPQPHRTSQAQDDVKSSRRHSGSGALTTSKTSSTGSSADHQPCIIPDSPITTRGCSDTHPPTEPRSVTSASGRPVMDLPLPRFGFDRHRLRPAVTQPSGVDPASTGSQSSSQAVPVDTGGHPVSSSSSSSVVTVRTDVAAPFSPGLLSPAMSPQALRLDTLTTTTATTATTTTVTVNSTSSTLHQQQSTASSTTHQQAASMGRTDKDTSSAAGAADSSVSAEEMETVSSAVKTGDDAAASAVAAAGEVAGSDVDTVVKSADTSGSMKQQEPRSDNTAAATAPTMLPLPAVSAGTPHKDIETSATADADLLSPGSPADSQSLEDRIRALDEKLNIQKTFVPLHLTSSDLALTQFDYSRFRRRKQQQPATGTSVTASETTTEPSDYVKSLLSKSSIFDQDTRRLEQLHTGKLDAAAAADVTAAAAGACSSLSDSAGSTTFLSRMRHATHDLSLQLPLSSSSSSSSAVYPSSAGYRSSDLSLQLCSPGVGSNAGGPGLTSSWSLTPGSGPWTSSWGVAASSSTLLSSAPSVSTDTRLPSQTPVVGVVSSPAVAPTDPRRVGRPATDIFMSPSVRRQDSHLSDTSSIDAALGSSTWRELDVSMACSKPKEMVSPPVSILKKPTVTPVLRDDFAIGSTTTKSSDVSQSSTDAASLTAAGMKRSAETAFGKELTSSTPNKIVARTPKPQPPSSTSEADSHSSINRLSDADSQAACAAVKRPEPAKKPSVQSKPLMASKADEKKTDHRGVTFGASLSGKASSEDASKAGAGSTVKATQNKVHSSITQVAGSASTTTMSKSHTHRDNTRPSNISDAVRRTSIPKDSSAPSGSDVMADRHSGTTAGGSSGGKAKSFHSAASKELAFKEDKLITFDEVNIAVSKDKSSISHAGSSTKQHTYPADHRGHVDKASSSRDDGSKTLLKTAALSSVSKSTSKTATARDPVAKADKTVHSKPLKTEVSSGMRKENSSTEPVRKDSAGHLKPSSSLNKFERLPHRSEKDESKPSLSNVQAKPMKKPTSSSTQQKNKLSSTSSSSKPSSAISSKLKHSEKSSSSDQKGHDGGKKAEQRNQSDKRKKMQSAASDKNAKKKTTEKRPEDKREVSA